MRRMIFGWLCPPTGCLSLSLCLIFPFFLASRWISFTPRQLFILAGPAVMRWMLGNILGLATVPPHQHTPSDFSFFLPDFFSLLLPSSLTCLIFIPPLSLSLPSLTIVPLARPPSSQQRSCSSAWPRSSESASPRWRWASAPSSPAPSRGLCVRQSSGRGTASYSTSWTWRTSMWVHAAVIVLSHSGVGSQSLLCVLYSSLHSRFISFRLTGWQSVFIGLH